MDRVVAAIVGLGVPGLILLVAVSTGGLAGGAAIVAALAFLGGPLGMLGGIALLGLLVLISQSLAKFGLEKILSAVIAKMKSKGKSKSQIINEVNGYPISSDLKNKLKELLNGM